MLLAHPTDGRQQNLGVGVNSIDNAEPCHQYDNIVGGHMCDECIYEINLAKRLSQACVPLVTGLASLWTDHILSGRPIRDKYKHFRTICEHNFENSPIDSSSSFEN